MLISAKIDNFLGISKPIYISTLANNKIKHKKNCYTNISKKHSDNILKCLCIIGSNGSGKTSFLNAFSTIQAFINFPFRRSTKNDTTFIEQLKKMPEDILNQILTDLNTLNLPSQNINRKEEKTTIELEYFIPERAQSLSGIYRYKLVYDKNYLKTGVIEESLFYKNNLSSIKEKNIFTIANNIESELGTKILYKNNTILEKNKSEDLNLYYQSFFNEILNYSDIMYNGANENLLECYKHNKKRFIKLSNLADDKIQNVAIEKQENQEILLFVNKANNKLEFEQLSLGTQKVIVAGNKILNAIENNMTIYIDEIETSLHPSLAKFLVEIIQYPSKNSFSQLIMTTHSPYLINLFENDQIVYIDNRDDNYAFRTVNEAVNDKSNPLTKDKSIVNAITDDLLIKNPDNEKINEFMSGKND